VSEYSTPTARSQPAFLLPSRPASSPGPLQTLPHQSNDDSSSSDSCTNKPAPTASAHALAALLRVLSALSPALADALLARERDADTGGVAATTLLSVRAALGAMSGAVGPEVAASAATVAHHICCYGQPAALHGGYFSATLLPSAPAVISSSNTSSPFAAASPLQHLAGCGQPGGLTPTSALRAALSAPSFTLRLSSSSAQHLSSAASSSSNGSATTAARRLSSLGLKLSVDVAAAAIDASESSTDSAGATDKSGSGSVSGTSSASATTPTTDHGGKQHQLLLIRSDEHGGDGSDARARVTYLSIYHQPECLGNISTSRWSKPAAAPSCTGARKKKKAGLTRPPTPGVGLGKPIPALARTPDASQEGCGAGTQLLVFKSSAAVKGVGKRTKRPPTPGVALDKPIGILSTAYGSSPGTSTGSVITTALHRATMEQEHHHSSAYGKRPPTPGVTLHHTAGATPEWEKEDAEREARLLDSSAAPAAAVHFALPVAGSLVTATSISKTQKPLAHHRRPPTPGSALAKPIGILAVGSSSGSVFERKQPTTNTGSVAMSADAPVAAGGSKRTATHCPATPHELQQTSRQYARASGSDDGEGSGLVVDSTAAAVAAALATDSPWRAVATAADVRAVAGPARESPLRRCSSSTDPDPARRSPLYVMSTAV